MRQGEKEITGNWQVHIFFAPSNISPKYVSIPDHISTTKSLLLASPTCPLQTEPLRKLYPKTVKKITLQTQDPCCPTSHHDTSSELRCNACHSAGSLPSFPYLLCQHTSPCLRPPGSQRSWPLMSSATIWRSFGRVLARPSRTKASQVHGQAKWDLGGSDCSQPNPFHC